MKKHNYFITAAATKYWAKEVKKGRLHVATKGEYIYILNGFNAFVIPNNQTIYAELVQPATLRTPPEDGRAYTWINGAFREEAAADTVNLIDRIIAADTAPVTRTPFTTEHGGSGDTLRIYKLHSGKLAGINAKYDSMVDFTFAYSATMANTKAAAVFSSGDFTAILMPVYFPALEDLARALAEVQ